ncbi:MAG TPA: matrixin family metalloprotease [Bacteriovoracaceae bacterium]|nr:matrixin family metalloprotease [Bacteriovoracaceae bacterium]
MRFFLVISVLLFSVACVPSKKKESATVGAINRESPYLWADYAAPKTLRISSDFSADEVTNITAMSTAWKSSVTDQKTFFNYGATTPEITNSLSNMDSMLDSTLGVYKTINWPSSLPSSALAVTQIFGRRHNVGTATEFVDIEHADILVNYDIHSFDTADSGSGYDLRTVVLHEMGHFIGLQHKSTSSNRTNSVMFPSISSSEEKRAPKAIDIADISAKYGIPISSSGGGVSSAVIKEESPVVYEANPQDPGEPVKILIELHADGECVHKIDGVLTGRHLDFGHFETDSDS